MLERLGIGIMDRLLSLVCIEPDTPDVAQTNPPSPTSPTPTSPEHATDREPVRDSAAEALREEAPLM